MIFRLLHILFISWIICFQAAAAEKLVSGPVGMSFVLISPGNFYMGSPINEEARNDDEYRHLVTIKSSFYLQTTEVTQAQWKVIMGSNPSAFRHCGDLCPVESVSWDDVQEFIRRLNKKEKKARYRLPTEEEWEYAARAGTSTAIYTGPLRILGYSNAPALDRIAWYGGNSCASYEGAFDCRSWPDKQNSCSSCGPHPVAQKKPNAWGLYDIIGNVWEWVQDDYEPYSAKPAASFHQKKGRTKVFRGGSWNYAPRSCRAAYRLDNVPSSRLSFVGFRLALEP
ncbi:MAG TPA: formylglycine-generating enzyme family protein [Smithellaceae bacterium]|nr:formylglycine-generating enzyme family protein [Smithellaceae bacterium]